MRKWMDSMMWRITTRALLIWCSLLLSSLALAGAAHAQTSQPDATDSVAITIDIPAEARIGGVPIAFSIAVRNTHPRLATTFTALILVESGLAGPENWSAKVTPVVDTEAGRIYRWTASVAALQTVTLEATSSTGNELGVQPALTVRVLSNQDQLVSTREIELLPSNKAARGLMALSDISGDSCDLEEECLLLLGVSSPSFQPVSGGPFETEGCEFLGLDEEFTIEVDRVDEGLFWFVTRTRGAYGSGCTISVPLQIGNRNVTAIYREKIYTYLPALPMNEAVGQ